MNWETDAEKSRNRQEKWRQKQISIMYRNGRPIFTPQAKIPCIKLFQNKYQNDLNIFHHESILTRKIHDKDLKCVN